MASALTLLKNLLGINNAKITNVVIDEDHLGQKRLTVEVKVHKRHANNCPYCDRKCPGYTSGTGTTS